MEKELKYLILVAVLILSGVFTGWWLGKQYPEKTLGTLPPIPGGGDGGSVGTSGAHQIAVSNNTACISPPSHLGSSTTITKTNPMFCYDTFGYAISDWRFDLKTYPGGQIVSGCTTGGFVPPPTSPATTSSIACSTILTPGMNNYYGDLQYHYGGTLIHDNQHYFSPQ